MNDICRKALTSCMELAYNFAKSDYIADCMASDEAIQEAMVAVTKQTQIKLSDFTMKMLETSNVLLPPRILKNFMENRKFGVNGI